jgi:hypothetical protein
MYRPDGCPLGSSDPTGSGMGLLLYPWVGSWADVLARLLIGHGFGRSQPDQTRPDCQPYLGQAATDIADASSHKAQPKPCRPRGELAGEALELMPR